MSVRYGIIGLGNQGSSYLFNIFESGEPSMLAASVPNLTLGEAIEVEDTATLICEGASRFIFNASNGSAADCPVELTLFTDNETLKIMPKQVLTGDELHNFDYGCASLGKACYGSSHEALISDFYDCIINQQEKISYRRSRRG